VAATSSIWGEQRLESILVLGAEPRDRRVIWPVLGAEHTEGHISQAPALDLPRGPHALAVRIDQQGQQHVRVIARRPGTAHTPADVKSTGIQRLDRLQQEPHHVIRGQPLPHVRRHQERLITLNQTIRLGHTTWSQTRIKQHYATRILRQALRPGDPQSHLLDERDRIAERPLPAGGQGPRPLPHEQAALKCLYLVTRSLDPTGTGRTRWAMRWKPALNAFAITFGDRFPGAETY
jgi:hypothetical protein